MKYAKVIVDISHEKVDRPFCYRIPERLEQEVQVGCCVEIPFGKGNTVRKGYVIERSKITDYDPEKIKEIIAVSDGVEVETVLIRLAAWIREKYGSTMIQALKTVLPVKTRVKHKKNRMIDRLWQPEQIRELMEICERKQHGAKYRLLRELLEYPSLPLSPVIHKLHLSSSVVSGLQKAGVIRVSEETEYRNPVSCDGEVKKVILSQKQIEIADSIWEDYSRQDYKTYLIHGITGSGKTQVYLELIERVVDSGRSVIVLIPEIALTFQTLMRFRNRFSDRVSVLNSSMSQGERYDQCERAKKGEIDIIIGPRSALFTPFKRIGMIFIDEEHEGAYKSESMPTYHAREVAEELARLHGASLVLGSATPSLESYMAAKEGRYRLFTLEERLTGESLPEVYIEDLRAELKKGNRSVFSDRLRELIRDRLVKKEQIMLFLNRRGYAGFISCRSCGHVMKCPHCNISLSYHRKGRLICHYCGHEEEYPQKCPGCGSPYLMGFKAGTQKIEEQFIREFGEVSILRMDRDTTAGKDSYNRILSDFMEGKAQVLIGTQMIVKGHDFPNVTLVGILAADLSLAVGDYRASERTFQLLTQAAGRAGRGSIPGEVVIQSYQPEHYAIRYAAEQNYEGFYEEEILYRRLAGYPPAANLLQVQIFSENEEEGMELGKELKQLIQKGLMDQQPVCIGPAGALVSKINDIYRFSLLLKHPEEEILIQARSLMEARLKEREDSRITVQFDRNPMQAF